MANAKRKPRGMPESVAQGTRILGRVSGRPALLYACSKAQGIIALESPAEKTVAQLADLDPRVLSVKAQPLTVDVITGRLFYSRDEVIDGRRMREKPEVKKREYTPDLLLLLRGGRQLIIEVKNTLYPGDAEYWEKVEQAATVLRMNGYDFIVITLGHQSSHPLAQNADLLTSFRANYQGALTPEQMATVKSMLHGRSEKLGVICSQLQLNLRESPALFLSGLLSTDLRTSRLSISSDALLANGGLRHLELLPLD